MGKTLVFTPKSLLKPKICGGIFGSDIPTKSQSATRESEKLIRRRSLFYKDYQKGIKKADGLSHEEFIRRFAMHILPKDL